MSNVFEIPLQAKQQSFNITLLGITYKFVVTWCDPNQAWTLDIYNEDGTILLLGGAPLITGANLLAQYDYLFPAGVPGQLLVQSDNDPGLVPSFATLGVTGHLYLFQTND